MSDPRRTDCEGFYRRDFLKLGTAGLLGLTLPDLLRLEARGVGRDAERTANAKSVIMVWLAGGPATIDMWDLKPDAPEGVRAQSQRIPPSAPAAGTCEHLPNMANPGAKATVDR